MAKETLNLEVKSNIKSVTKDSDELSESLGKAADETTGLGTGLTQTGAAGSKGFQAISSAVYGLGIALKAIGIGLIIGLFASLKESLERNQSVMNGVNTVMTTISTTFNQVVDVLIDVVAWVTASQDRFDGLSKVITSLMTIALTPLKLAFLTIKVAVQNTMLAWEDSFLGGGDEAKIAELRADMLGTANDIKEVGLAALKAGKAVVENVGDAITEIGAIGEMVIDQISKISVKANYEMAAATTAATNSSKLAEAQIQGLIEKNDLLAESQRQIRDDERKTFAERIEANKKIAEILDDQKIEMMKLANTRVASAALELEANKENIDLQVAYQATLNDRAGVEAQIAGFKSEQLTNEASLTRELIETQNELSESVLEGTERELLELENAYELKLEMARKAGVDTLAIENKYYDDVVDIVMAATAAELAIKKAASDKDLARDKVVNDAKVNMANNALGAMAALAGENEAAGKAIAVAQTIFATQQAIMSALSGGGTDNALPYWVKLGNAISAGVMGAASIKTILSTSSATAGSGGGGGGGAAAAPPSPQMMSGSFDLGAGQEVDPIQAYVVSDEITDSQNSLAIIRRRATI